MGDLAANTQPEGGSPGFSLGLTGALLSHSLCNVHRGWERGLGAGLGHTRLCDLVQVLPSLGRHFPYLKSGKM